MVHVSSSWLLGDAVLIFDWDLYYFTEGALGTLFGKILSQYSPSDIASTSSTVFVLIEFGLKGSGLGITST